MELYQLKMEMGGDLHDHINKFIQLVSQLLNANDKLLSYESRHWCAVVVGLTTKVLQSFCSNIAYGKINFEFGWGDSLLEKMRE